MSSKHTVNKNHQWLILLLLFLTIIVAFIGRLSTSVALENIGDELVWSHAQKGFLGGVLMGIFLVSYGFSNVFFSPNIDRYGSKMVLVISLAGSSIAVFLGAIFGHIYSVFLLSRLLLGLSQGVMFPVASKVIAGWFTVETRGKANSIFITGASAGVALAPIIMGPVMFQYGWRASFYVVAAMGFLLTIPIAFFIRDSSAKTIVYNKEIDVKKAFKEMLGEKEFKQITVGFTAVNTMWWGATLWVPTLLEEMHGLNIGVTPYVASIPYLGAIAGLLTGTWISDLRGNTNTVITFSLFMTGVMFMVLAFAPVTGLFMAVALLVLLFFFGQLAPPLFFTKLQNSIEGNQLGSATGLMNGIANTFGVVGPISVGVVVAITGSYSLGLLSLTAVAFSGLIGFRRLL